ncbi:hypothetical protein BBL85_07995 [Vibrio parahaemolyticus]|nr:hypothetical protein BBL85_07995 [Vibrio parahaemolyticus]
MFYGAFVPEWTKSPSVVDLKQELKDRPTTTVTVTEPSKGFNFFPPFKTEEQLKKAYKSLSLAYNPDRGGDTGL